MDTLNCFWLKSANTSPSLALQSPCIIDGFKFIGGGTLDETVRVSSNHVHICNSIVWDSSGSCNNGIAMWSGGGKCRIYNNTIVGFNYGIYSSNATTYAYNNTIYKYRTQGIRGSGSGSLWKNNIIYSKTGTTINYSAFAACSSNAVYESSINAGCKDCISLYSVGADSFFVDTLKDYKLKSNGLLLDVGKNMSADTTLSPLTDSVAPLWVSANGVNRGTSWDIGANEYLPTAPTITFTCNDTAVSDSAILFVTATGEGLHYQWYNDAGAITNDNDTLKVKPTASGNYWCMVYNSADSVFSSMIYVTFLSITITTQPDSQLVRNNTLVTFTVVATGASPLHYQWVVNNSNYGTDNDSVSWIADTSYDSSKIMCKVWSAGGDTAYSDTALLRVYQPCVWDSIGIRQGVYLKGTRYQVIDSIKVGNLATPTVWEKVTIVGQDATHVEWYLSALILYKGAYPMRIYHSFGYDDYILNYNGKKSAAGRSSLSLELSTGF